MKPPTFEQRLKVHAALGEPSRLAIVDCLVLSDRTPLELGRLLGIPSNLLARHLDVLEEASLVSRHSSLGDRRRKYVHLRRESLAGLWAKAEPKVGNVVFVCTQNSARSQLAAALWSRRTGVPTDSAGTEPAARVHPGALAAARRVGLDLAEAQPRRLRDVAGSTRLITVCDRAREQLEGRWRETWWHWSIPDPVPARTDRAFDHAIAAIEARIESVIGLRQAPEVSS